MYRTIILPIFRSTRLCVTACGIMHPRCCRPVAPLWKGSEAPWEWLFWKSVISLSKFLLEVQVSCSLRCTEREAITVAWIINFEVVNITGTNRSAISTENVLPFNILCFRNLQSHTAAAITIIRPALATDTAAEAVERYGPKLNLQNKRFVWDPILNKIKICCGCSEIWYDTIWYDMIWYICLTAIG